MGHLSLVLSRGSAHIVCYRVDVSRFFSAPLDWTDPILGQPACIENGGIRVSDLPGFGISLSEAKLKNLDKI